MDNADVIVGLLTLFSLKYPCGRCHKLRIQPSGSLSVCLQQQETFKFAGMSQEEMEKLIARLFIEREKLDVDHPNRNHFRAQLGELRFGRVNEAKSIDYFQQQLENKKGE